MTDLDGEPAGTGTESGAADPAATAPTAGAPEEAAPAGGAPAEDDAKQRSLDAAARLGERVARVRTQRNRRVSELARLIGVSPSLISQIERG
jgi:ribosome-binding protein aMBF1 (putative translation factor)